MRVSVPPPACGRGLGGGLSAIVKRLPDRYEHALGLSKNLEIREAKLAHAALADEVAASSIVLQLRVGPMLSTVDLDRESSSSAVEVEDIGAKRVLSAELEARETLVAHEHPQKPLGIRRVVPKAAREAQKPRIYGLYTSHARASVAAAPRCRPSPNPSRKREGDQLQGWRGSICTQFISNGGRVW